MALFCSGGMALVSCAEPKKQNYTMNDEVVAQIGSNTDTATFGTGCFWCTEAIFQRLKGVVKVVSGYSGGNKPNPTYEEVCSGATGYAEVCRIYFDSTEISFPELLKVFWKVHDPTTLNRQGNDVGTQYRSVIFYNNDEQKKEAEFYKGQLDKSGAFNAPIVTAIEPVKNFYAAEDYHQNYYNNNSGQAYCHFVIQPKLKKFEEAFQTKLKTY
ncbi:MAG: peptide-methionine (S)-S-oxide reductase MsrA [Chitinophagaceae bacterium]